MKISPFIVSKPFSKNDSNIIKGLGILMIMFHNFFHLIPPIIGENEFDFSADRFQNFLHFTNTEPLNFLRFSSSYFGHYGVQLFIFISSYGLYLAYNNKNIGWLNFMKRRIGKLYPTLVLGICLVLLIWFLRLQVPNLTMIKSILLKFTLLYGFFPNEALSISGPWWFFSVIVQLYAFFPLLLYILKRRGPNALLVIALFFIGFSMVIDLYFKIPGTSVYFTFIGQLPVFLLGLYFAAHSEIKISTGVLIVAVMIFSLGNVNEYAWYFSFVAVTLILLSGAILLIPLIRKFKLLHFFLEFTGSISLFLFVVNGPLRYPFFKIAEKIHSPFLIWFVAFIFVLFTYSIAITLRFLEQQIREFVATRYQLRPLLQKIKTNRY